MERKLSEVNGKKLEKTVIVLVTSSVVRSAKETLVLSSVVGRTLRGVLIGGDE